MDEPEVWKDNSWTDDSDTYSSTEIEASRLKQQGHLVEKHVTALQHHAPAEGQTFTLVNQSSYHNYRISIY